VTLEDNAKAANKATQIPNGTHGFKERLPKTLGLYQIIAMAMTLKTITPLPTYPKPSYCPGAAGKAGKNREVPAGLTNVKKSAEYSPNPFAPREIPDPRYPKAAKTPSVAAP
jgi:hypothetical protein